MFSAKSKHRMSAKYPDNFSVPDYSESFLDAYDPYAPGPDGPDRRQNSRAYADDYGQFSPDSYDASPSGHNRNDDAGGGAYYDAYDNYAYNDGADEYAGGNDRYAGNGMPYDDYQSAFEPTGRNPADAISPQDPYDINARQYPDAGMRGSASASQWNSRGGRNSGRSQMDDDDADRLAAKLNAVALRNNAGPVAAPQDAWGSSNPNMQNYNDMPMPPPNGGRLFCAGCQNSIDDLRDAFEIDVLNAWFHADCFRCSACRKSFSDDLPYVPHLGQAFCEPDFEALFLANCAACKKPITDGKIAHALGRTFHERHLRCRVCKHRVPPGRHLEHKGRIYCDDDYRKLVDAPQTCAGCRATITGDCIRALGTTYHRECFNCAVCQKPFPDKKFFVLDSRPHCRYHYHERNGSLCGTCNQPIEGPCVHVAEMDKRYHSQCWSCVKCGVPLNGTYYAYNNDAYCERDIEPVFRQFKKGKGMAAPTKRRTMMYNY